MSNSRRSIRFTNTSWNANYALKVWRASLDSLRYTHMRQQHLLIWMKLQAHELAHTDIYTLMFMNASVQFNASIAALIASISRLACAPAVDLTAYRSYIHKRRSSCLTRAYYDKLTIALCTVRSRCNFAHIIFTLADRFIALNKYLPLHQPTRFH